MTLSVRDLFYQPRFGIKCIKDRSHQTTLESPDVTDRRYRQTNYIYDYKVLYVVRNVTNVAKIIEK